MSIQYYQTNADEFYENTANVDMTSIYRRFLHFLPPRSIILDAGCGSGRDTKAFIELGYTVDAFDGSKKLVELAKDNTGIDVKHMLFHDLNASHRYDGIWTCASLLHVPQDELFSVMKLFARSLKEGGIWYASFKYGEGERTVSGRVFTDLNESKLSQLIGSIENITLKEIWITEDKRPDRREKWLNCILVKT
jgi:SAM-dependent methyltransferase